MPFDDDAADDVTGFGPPPHPDDRLWRHPSELVGSPTAVARASGHRWPWGLVAGAGTVGVMLVGVGALAVGMRDPGEGSRVASPADIGSLDSGPLTSFDGPGVLSGPAFGPGEVGGVAPSMVRIEGAGTGSGVVVRGDGIVLTSADLVGNLPDVEVTFSDGSTETGTNLGTDPVTGIAVVDLPGGGFDAAGLVAPDDLVEGDTVLCAGVDGDGLTTGAGRLATLKTQFTPYGGTAMDGLLKITPRSGADAALMGGAVVDASGSVLAITTTSDGIWYYATPIDVAGKVADDIFETGTAQHTWVGITGNDAPATTGGVTIDSVDPDGPASEALRPGDVITDLDGTDVVDMSTLVSELQLYHPGDEVELSYRRGGEPADATLELDSLPAP